MSHFTEYCSTLNQALAQEFGDQVGFSYLDGQEETITAVWEQSLAGEETAPGTLPVLIVCAEEFSLGEPEAGCEVESDGRRYVVLPFQREADGSYSLPLQAIT